MTEFADAAPAASDQTAPVEAPSQVATEAPAALAPAETSKPASIEESLKAVWDKHNPPRRPDGKFAPLSPAPAAEETPVEASEAISDQPATGELKPAAPAIQAPMSWSNEQKADWAKIPPAQQSYIAQRDKETHDAISRAGQQIKAYEPIGNVVSQFQETFKRNNLHPAEGIARLLAVEERLAKDPLNTVFDIAKAYGVDLQTGQTGQDGQGEQPDAAMSAVRAQLAETQSQLRQVTSFLTAQQTEQTSVQRDALARQIADFADARDKGGNALHPHLDQVSNVMAALLQSDPNLDLEQAYDRAVYADPTIRSSLLEVGRKAEEVKRKEEAARKLKDAKNAATVNVSSSPASGSNPKTMDDTLRELDGKFFGVHR